MLQDIFILTNDQETAEVLPLLVQQRSFSPVVVSSLEEIPDFSPLFIGLSSLSSELRPKLKTMSFFVIIDTSEVSRTDVRDEFLLAIGDIQYPLRASEIEKAIHYLEIDILQKQYKPIQDQINSSEPKLQPQYYRENIPSIFILIKMLFLKLFGANRIKIKNN